MITKNKIGLVLLVVVTVVIGGYFLTNKKGKIDTLNPSVTVSSIPSPSPTLFPSPTKSPLNKSFLPATCSIQGSINFFTPTMAANYGPKISYTGIDNPARQINWKVAPADDLKVGPNLDVALKLPDGESPVSVTLPPSPVSKNYSLTVSMTYGRLTNGGVRIYEVNCSGQVKVTLSY